MMNDLFEEIFGNAFGGGNPFASDPTDPRAMLMQDLMRLVAAMRNYAKLLGDKRTGQAGE